MINKSQNQLIAKMRISKLLDLAALTNDESLSSRYVEISKNLATRYRVQFTRDQKRLFCKHCNSFFRQGINSRVRLSNGVLIIRCLKCNAIKRLVYK